MIKNIKKIWDGRGNNSGFTFIEILIAIALIGIVFTTLLGVGFLVLNVSSSIKKQTQADSLIKSEFEALRNFRDGTQWAINGLGTVNTGSGNPYYLVNNSGEWELVFGTETSGIFARQIVFDEVSRDPSTKNIETVYNPSNRDIDTKKITITVTWPNRTMQTVSYFTNWKND